MKESLTIKNTELIKNLFEHFKDLRKFLSDDFIPALFEKDECGLTIIPDLDDIKKLRKIEKFYREFSSFLDVFENCFWEYYIPIIEDHVKRTDYRTIDLPRFMWERLKNGGLEKLREKLPRFAWGGITLSDMKDGFRLEVHPMG